MQRIVSGFFCVFVFMTLLACSKQAVKQEDVIIEEDSGYYSIIPDDTISIDKYKILVVTPHFIQENEDLSINYSMEERGDTVVQIALDGGVSFINNELYLLAQGADSVDVRVEYVFDYLFWNGDFYTTLRCRKSKVLHFKVKPGDLIAMMSDEELEYLSVALAGEFESQKEDVERMHYHLYKQQMISYILQNYLSSDNSYEVNLYNRAADFLKKDYKEAICGLSIDYTLAYYTIKIGKGTLLIDDTGKGEWNEKKVKTPDCQYSEASPLWHGTYSLSVEYEVGEMDPRVKNPRYVIELSDKNGTMDRHSYDDFNYQSKIFEKGDTLYLLDGVSIGSKFQNIPYVDTLGIMTYDDGAYYITSSIVFNSQREGSTKMELTKE